ncbi:MAG: DNA repair protein RecN [Fusobacteriaceae bacterium]
MLKELKIENLAIIDKLDLEFKEGFISLTGETGAGKSIILSGINLLIGDKGSVDMIRDGAESLLAQGVFEITDEQVKELKNLGIDIDDNEVIVRRSLDRNGKGKASINNLRVPMSSLKDIMSALVDIVGQHSHQMLLQKSNHIRLLDKFLRADGVELKKEIETKYYKYHKISEEIKHIESNKKEISDKKELYEFQLSEINEIAPKMGEDTSLEDEYKKLFNAGKIKEKIENASIFLKNGEINALNFINNSRKGIELLSKYGSEFQEISERLEKVYYELEDIVDVISDIDEGIDSDNNHLEVVITRLDKINKLKLKYGSSISEILEYKEKIDLKLKEFDESGFEVESLIKEQTRIYNEYMEKAKKLTDIRKNVAKDIEKKLQEELFLLNMKEAKLMIKFEELKHMTGSGMDSVEFYISTNLGQEPKQLVKIASGGEISRIMLALKVIFSKVDNLAMILFDEIDSGVGGETVKKIGDKLREIGENSQLICITHSPAIAAKSQQQFYIEKFVLDGKTVSSVVELDKESRIKEIARMLAGENASQSVMEHAKELLNAK